MLSVTESREQLRAVTEINIMDKDCVLKIEDLKISFKKKKGMVNAIRGVDFELRRGE